MDLIFEYEAHGWTHFRRVMYNACHQSVHYEAASMRLEKYCDECCLNDGTFGTCETIRELMEELRK